LFEDRRGGRIAIVAHCILNQNSRVLGLAERSGVITEIVEFLMRNGGGIIQMPWPELSYAGLLRQALSKDQYDTVMFRSHCREIAEEIVDQIQEYRKCGINIEIVIGVNGSPSCGVGEASMGSSGRNMSTRESVEGSGILMEELRFALEERSISIPFYGIGYESMREDLVEIKKQLEVKLEA